MANISDLNTPSISDMDPDEAIEYLRKLRLSRRVPLKKQQSSTTKKAKKQTQAAGKISKDQAAELLKLLGG